MNIMQHIKDFFSDAKKRNIFISCAAAVVIIAVAVPVGLALYGNNTCLLYTSDAADEL